MTKNIARALMVLLVVALLAQGMVVAAVAEEAKPVIGISWSYTDQEAEYVEYYDCVIEAAGGIPVHIPQIVSSVVTYGDDNMIVADQLEASGMLKAEYADAIKAKDYSLTNLAEAMDGIDGVFFVGGEDISPTLYAQPQTECNNGEGINATRDVSDYMLMAYCIDNDIPLFAACRGEQMLGIVSGCQFAQDIPNYFALMGADYDDTHRMPPETPDRDYARHSVDVVAGTLAADIIGADTLDNVSSWHHQTVVDVKGTDLVVSATTTVNGVTTIEGLELPGKTYIVGTQFHPENDVYIALKADDTTACPCNYDVCLGFFTGLVNAAASKAGDAELAPAA